MLIKLRTPDGNLYVSPEHILAIIPDEDGAGNKMSIIQMPGKKFMDEGGNYKNTVVEHRCLDSSDIVATAIANVLDEIDDYVTHVESVGAAKIVEKWLNKVLTQPFTTEELKQEFTQINPFNFIGLHAELLFAITSLVDEGKEVNLITVSDFLEKAGRFTGGLCRTYINDIALMDYSK